MTEKITGMDFISRECMIHIIIWEITTRQLTQINIFSLQCDKQKETFSKLKQNLQIRKQAYFLKLLRRILNISYQLWQEWMKIWHMPNPYDQIPISEFPERLWKYPNVQNCVPMPLPIPDPHKPLRIRVKHRKAANRSDTLTKLVFALEVNNKIKTWKYCP